MTEEGLGRITRREFGKVAGGASITALILPASQEIIRPAAQDAITYRTALIGDIKLQESYINQILLGKIPQEVISVEFLNQDLADRLRKDYDFVIPYGSLGVVIPMWKGSQNAGLMIAPPEQLGKGVRSKVIVNPSILVQMAKTASGGVIVIDERTEFNQELETLLVNKFQNNIFVEADYFNHGIPGYPIEMFREGNGNFNYNLYNTSLRIFALSREYNGLISNQRYSQSRYISTYAAGLKGQGELLAASVSNFTTKNTSPELLKKLRQDFNPNRLFPDPKTLRRA